MDIARIRKNIKNLLKGLTADAAPDLVAFEHAFDIDHVIDRVLGPMMDRAIDRRTIAWLRERNCPEALGLDN